MSDRLTGSEHDKHSHPEPPFPPARHRAKPVPSRTLLTTPSVILLDRRQRCGSDRGPPARPCPTDTEHSGSSVPFTSAHSAPPGHRLPERPLAPVWPLFALQTSLRQRAGGESLSAAPLGSSAGRGGRRSAESGSETIRGPGGAPRSGRERSSAAEEAGGAAEGSRRSARLTRCRRRQEIRSAPLGESWAAALLSCRHLYPRGMTGNPQESRSPVSPPPVTRSAC